MPPGVGDLSVHVCVRRGAVHVRIELCTERALLCVSAAIAKGVRLYVVGGVGPVFGSAREGKYSSG